MRDIFLGTSVRNLKVQMDEIRGNQLLNSNRTVYVYGEPGVIHGIHGRAVQLDGRNQYVDVGGGAICDGDLTNCPRGFTGRIKILPHQLQDNTYFVSSPYLNLYQQGGQLVGEVKTDGHAWRTYSSPLVKDMWNQVELEISFEMNSSN